ncbi:MAG: urease accessory protein UreD [Solirubrobacteraceae bacterium]
MSPASGVVTICVQRRGARSIVTGCSGTAPLAPRVVTGEREDWAQVVMVSTVAGPLPGDEVSIEIEIGPGARLNLCSAAATIAYPRWGAGRERRSIQRLRCTIAAGGRLAWRQAELVLTSGARHESRVDLRLRADAAAMVQETIIRGRHGEPGGSLLASLCCDLEGRALLRESVVVEPDDPVTDSSVVLAGARVYGSVSLLGLRATSEDPAELTLARPGCLLRAMGDDALAVGKRLAPARAAYLARLVRASESPRWDGLDSGRSRPRVKSDRPARDRTYEERAQWPERSR